MKGGVLMYEKWMEKCAIALIIILAMANLQACLTANIIKNSSNANISNEAQVEQVNDSLKLEINGK